MVRNAVLKSGNQSRSPYQYSEEIRNAIVDMYKNGFRPKEISIKLNVKPVYVWTLIRNTGIRRSKEENTKLESDLNVMFDRIMRKVQIDSSGCMFWIGSLDQNGYAKIKFRKRQYPVHRITYEKIKGKIPEKYVIDHLCRKKNCVNPEHLEAVTSAENGRRNRGHLPKLQKTHCSRGHPLTPENSEWYGGWKSCKLCRKKRNSGEIVIDGRYKINAYSIVTEPILRSYEMNLW